MAEPSKFSSEEKAAKERAIRDELQRRGYSMVDINTALVRRGYFANQPKPATNDD